MDQLQHPRIHNADTSTQLIGIAFDDATNLVYYCSHAGYGVSLKAIFSSLASNTKKNVGCSSLGLVGGTGTNPITQWTAAIPDTQMHHSVVCYRDDNLILAVDHNAATLTDTDDPDVIEKRRELLGDQMQRLQHQLGLFLNQHTDVPVHDTWVDTLWTYGLLDGAIKPITTYGDCLGAWLVDPEHNWLDMTQALLADDTLLWPET